MFQMRSFVLFFMLERTGLLQLLGERFGGGKNRQERFRLCKIYSSFIAQGNELQSMWNVWCERMLFVRRVEMRFL
jgi:hypothetical protein